MTQPGAASHGMERGYRFPEAARRYLKDWHQTNCPLSVVVTLGNHARLLGGPLIVLGAATAEPVFGVVLAPFQILIAAQALRGLECLVHEGSHFNFSRRNKALNDCVVNTLAAMPVLQDVKSFRPQHYLHHRDLGDDTDPCFIRWGKLAWSKLNRTSAWHFLGGVLSRLPSYQVSWKALAGVQRRVALRGILWHLIVAVPVLIAGSAALTGGEAWWAGILLWLLFVAGPFVFVLPLLRFVGEAGKHDYEAHAGQNQTVFSSTITNCGTIHRVLFHPHGDGFHLLHHIDANISHHKLSQVHRWLLSNDPEYRKLRARSHVLQEA